MYVSCAGAPRYENNNFSSSLAFAVAFVLRRNLWDVAEAQALAGRFRTKLIRAVCKKSRYFSIKRIKGYTKLP